MLLASSNWLFAVRYNIIIITVVVVVFVVANIVCLLLNSLLYMINSLGSFHCY